MKRAIILLLLLPVLGFGQTAKHVRGDTLTATHVLKVGGSNAVKASDSTGFMFTRTQFNTETLNYVARADTDAWLPSWADINAKGYLVFADSATFLSYVKAQLALKLNIADSTTFLAYIKAAYATLESPRFLRTIGIYGVDMTPRAQQSVIDVVGGTGAPGHPYESLLNLTSEWWNRVTNSLAQQQDTSAFNVSMPEATGDPVVTITSHLGVRDTMETKSAARTLLAAKIAYGDTSEAWFLTRATANGLLNAKLSYTDTSLAWFVTRATLNGLLGAKADTADNATRTYVGLYAQPLDADLTDLADGTLTGSKVGSGIDAGNITTGTVGTDRYSAYGDLGAESKIGTGSTQVAAGDHNHSGVYQAADADLDDLADGTLTASKVPTFGASSVGVVPASGGGTTNYLRADGAWAEPPGGSGISAETAAGIVHDTVEIVRGRMAVNARDFGAKGDGITDDRPALQASLDTAYARGVACYIPFGTYLLSERPGPDSADLNLSPGAFVFGDGDNTILQRGYGADDTVSYCLSIYTTRLKADSSLNNYTIRDLQIRGATGGKRRGIESDGTGGDGGIFMGSGARLPINKVIIENVTVRDTKKEAILIWDADQARVTGCHVYNTNFDAYNLAYVRNLICTGNFADSVEYALEFVGTRAYTTTRDSVASAVIANNEFVNVFEYGLNIAGGMNVLAKSNILRAPAGWDTSWTDQAIGIFINPTPDYGIMGTLTLDGNIIEGFYTAGIGTSNYAAEDTSIDRIVIKNNMIYRTGANAISLNAPDSSKVGRVTIQGNEIADWNQRTDLASSLNYAGIYIGNIDSVTIVNNRVYNETGNSRREPVFFQGTTGMVIRDNDFRCSRDNEVQIFYVPGQNDGWQIFDNFGLYGARDNSTSINYPQGNPWSLAKFTIRTLCESGLIDSLATSDTLYIGFSNTAKVIDTIYVHSIGTCDFQVLIEMVDSLNQTASPTAILNATAITNSRKTVTPTSATWTAGKILRVVFPAVTTEPKHFAVVVAGHE